MKLNKLLLIVFLFTAAASAQDIQNYILSIGDTKLGGYLGIGGRYTTVLNDQDAGFLDFKGAVIINGEWGLGLTGSALYYDKQLSDLVNDGTYHLNVSYGGIFVERIFSFNNDFKFSVSIATGTGIAYYEYDKEYHKEKIWTEEIIDQTTFAFFEPGIEIQHRVGGNWWIGINAAYRNTSPLYLTGTDEDLLRKFTGGITIKYGVF